MIGRTLFCLMMSGWLLGLCESVASAQADDAADPPAPADTPRAVGEPSDTEPPEEQDPPAHAVDPAEEQDPPAHEAADPPRATSSAAAAPRAQVAATQAETPTASDAELASFLAEQTTDEPRVELYGFADFGLFHSFNDDDAFWHVSQDGNSSFFIGNVNLYVDAHLSEAVRSLIEIRFLYQPQNTVDSEGERRGVAPDHADRNRPLSWGGIEIERAWVEYNLHNLLTVRAGQWLTPYGIWNVDHGSPTVIPASRPFIIGQALMPERQTGLQLYGSSSLGHSLRVGYHATVSNGRGPLDAFRDLDENKAVGGRIFAELNKLGRWKLGGSSYYGRYTDAEREFASKGGTLVYPSIVHRQYDELVLAADLQWDLDRFHFQSELVHNQRAYTKGGRAASGSLLDSGVGGGGPPADESSWGTYALVAYRLPWANLMPYAYGEYFVWNASLQTLGILVGGLNWQPDPALVVKAQYMHAAAIGDEASFFENISDYRALQFQVAWAF